MKKVFIFVFLIFSAVLSFSQETELIFIKSMPEPDSELEDNYLTRPFDVIYRNGRYFVAESRDACVKILSKDGVVIKRMGRKGQGPGELTHVFDIAVNEDGNRIYCNDARYGRITVFDDNGNYKSTIKALQLFSNIEYFKNKIFVNSYNHVKNSLFAIYDTTGVIIKYFGEKFDENVNKINRFEESLYRTLLKTGKDRLYAVFTAIPYIRIYDKDGFLIKSIKIENELFTKKYNKILEGARRGVVNGRVSLGNICAGIVVDNRFIYYLVREVPTEILLYCINENGILEKIIPFKDKLPLPLMYRLTEKNGNQFIFADMINGCIKIYEERKKE